MPRLLRSIRTLPGSADVLDAGCGDGRYASWFPGDRYVGIDLGDNLPQTTRERTFIKVGIQNMPFADGSFDIVFCSLVIEHVPDVIVAIAELRRVLRPGGVCILSTGTKWAERIGEMPNSFWKPDCEDQGQAFHYFEAEDLSILRPLRSETP